MKRINRLTLLGFSFFLILFSACSGDDGPVINKIPLCEITAPLHSSSFFRGDVIHISAAVVDNDGTITSVSFSIDGIELENIANAPFEFDWDSSSKNPGTHYLKVVATDDNNESATDEIEITLKEIFSGPLIDIEGNEYSHAHIGNQCWMTENLATSTYNDGTPIPYVTENDDWKNMITPGFCWFENDVANKPIYGALYNWHVVETEKLCPLGWHVPTTDEWIELIDYLGGPDLAGSKLKEEGTTHWEDPNNANNQSGFTALATGYRHENDGTFKSLGLKSMHWSISTYNQSASHYLFLTNTMEAAQFTQSDNSYGFCVRCIKNQ